MAGCSVGLQLYWSTMGTLAGWDRINHHRFPPGPRTGSRRASQYASRARIPSVDVSSSSFSLQKSLVDAVVGDVLGDEYDDGRGDVVMSL